MPELPEAETIVRDLRGRILGARVAGTEVRHEDVLDEPPAAAFADALSGRTVSAVERRGKNVVLVFADGARLMVNLGMSGRLVVGDSPRAAELGHVAVAFDLDDGRRLLYDDARRFGRLRFLTPEAWARRTAELGHEPLADDFTGAALHRMTRASKVPIRNFLLDQTKVAGVGNIYANEALFGAAVRPTRRARTLTRAEAARLRDNLREVLEAAIQARGTTFSLYRDASGEAGEYLPRLRVYGRDGLPCPACGTPVKRVVLTNRSAFYCPRCQR